MKTIFQTSEQKRVASKLIATTTLWSVIAIVLLFPGVSIIAAEKQNELEPKVIDPGPVGGPPSDAIVLFDGKDLSQWKSDKGGETKWKVENGVATVNGTG